MNNSRSSVSIFLDEEDLDELEDLYCVACDKIFKTLKQKVNIPHTNLLSWFRRIQTYCA